MKRKITVSTPEEFEGVSSGNVAEIDKGGLGDFSLSVGDQIEFVEDGTGRRFMVSVKDASGDFYRFEAYTRPKPDCPEKWKPSFIVRLGSTYLATGEAGFHFTANSDYAHRFTSHAKAFHAVESGRIIGGDNVWRDIENIEGLECVPYHPVVFVWERRGEQYLHGVLQARGQVFCHLATIRLGDNGDHGWREPCEGYMVAWNRQGDGGVGLPVKGNFEDVKATLEAEIAGVLKLAAEAIR